MVAASSRHETAIDLLCDRFQMQRYGGTAALRSAIRKDAEIWESDMEGYDFRHATHILPDAWRSHEEPTNCPKYDGTYPFLQFLEVTVSNRLAGNKWNKYKNLWTMWDGIAEPGFELWEYHVEMDVLRIFKTKAFLFGRTHNSIQRLNLND